ncbi:MAG: methyl-accepting chemotaxis protein [Neomegalonema sp.]|nr:methyl-accepting chemotaxis protein [Neomegalonema sp.]
MKYLRSLSIGHRIRLGFAALLAITIAVSLGALSEVSDSGERAESSLSSFAALEAAEYTAMATTSYFGERSEANAKAVEKSTKTLEARLDALRASDSVDVDALTAEAARFRASFRAAEESDKLVQAKVAAVGDAAGRLNKIAIALVKKAGDELVKTADARKKAEAKLLVASKTAALATMIRRDTVTFDAEFSKPLQPDGFKNVASLSATLSSVKHAIARLGKGKPDKSIVEAFKRAETEAGELDRAFVDFKKTLKQKPLFFPVFQKKREAVLKAAAALKRAIGVLERDVKFISRRQTALQRKSREAALGAMRSSMALTEFRANAAAARSSFLAFVDKPTDASAAAALEGLSPLTEFILEHGKQLDKSLVKVLNDDIAMFGTGLSELKAGFARRAAALEALTAALAKLSDDVASAGRKEMTASKTAAAGASEFLIYAVIGAALLALIVSWVVARSISRPVRRITSEMKQVADGNLELAISDSGREDEIGEMAAAVEVFRENAQAVRRLGEEQKTRDAEAEAARKRMMVELQDAFGSVVEAAARGDFGGRVKTNFADAELNAIAEGMNRVLGTVGDFFGDLRNTLMALAEGDLTRHVDDGREGAFRDMALSANATVARLGELITAIQSASASIADSTRDMAGGARELSDRAERQAASLEETASTMEQMRTTVASNAQIAEGANGLASETRTKAQRGGDAVNDAKDAMARLAESAQRITDITSVIDGIAFQTNLLALNAAVEAARAGDAGKGFAVVAGEVRDLAQRSSQAARDIKALIDESSQQVGDGVQLVEAAGATLDEIVTGINELSDRVDGISTATREQATSVDEVHAAVQALDEMTQENAAEAERSAEAAQHFTAEADRLDSLVSAFRLDQAAAADRAA